MSQTVDEGGNSLSEDREDSVQDGSVPCLVDGQGTVNSEDMSGFAEGVIGATLFPHMYK